jgi:beta-galactosidase
VDSGNEISHESFKANHRKAFHGMALAIIQSKGQPGNITLRATSDGITPAVITLQAQ